MRAKKALTVGGSDVSSRKHRRFARWSTQFAGRCGPDPGEQSECRMAQSESRRSDASARALAGSLLTWCGSSLPYELEYVLSAADRMPASCGAISLKSSWMGLSLPFSVTGRPKQNRPNRLKK